MNILEKLWTLFFHAINAINFILGRDADAIIKCPRCGKKLAEEFPGRTFCHNVCPKCGYDPMAQKNE